MKNFICIIDPAEARPELEAFNFLSSLSELPLHYHLPAMHGMDSLKDPNYTNGLKGVVVMGSRASVNDDKPWQTAFNPWLKRICASGVPVFGICYGHQIIAHLHGAKVGYLSENQNKESGFREINFAEDPLWGAKRSGTLIVSHKEVVKDCPKDFIINASTNLVLIEGLHHKSLPIWSFQAHPEACPQFLINQKIPVPTDLSRLDFGHSLVEKFLHFCARHS